MSSIPICGCGDVPQLVAEDVKMVFIVLNPAAGSCEADVARQAFRRHFGGVDWVYDVYETTGKERVAEIVRAALGRGVDSLSLWEATGLFRGSLMGLCIRGSRWGSSQSVQETRSRAIWASHWTSKGH